MYCFSFLLLLGGSVPPPTPGNADQIVQKSAEVTEADRKAGLHYDFSETDLQSNGSTKTYRVHMLFGSPYQELIAVNRKPIPKDKADEEKRKLNEEAARRQKESPADHAHRVAEFQKETDRDRRFIEEFVHAFHFKLQGEQQIGPHHVYVIDAIPRRDFHPTDKESRVLTGMRGRMWIDKQTYQWVKVEADVVHPVSIEGFLAKVEPGTRFELEKTPVADNVWLPKHFAMFSRAKVLSVVRRRRHQDETYFDYVRTDTQSSRQ